MCLHRFWSLEKKGLASHTEERLFSWSLIQEKGNNGVIMWCLQLTSNITSVNFMSIIGKYSEEWSLESEQSPPPFPRPLPQSSIPTVHSDWQVVPVTFATGTRTGNRNETQNSTQFIGVRSIRGVSLPVSPIFTSTELYDITARASVWRHRCFKAHSCKTHDSILSKGPFSWK